MEQERDQFEPDPFRLDEEWVKQPGLFHDSGQKLADAREQWELAKQIKERTEDQLEKVEAEIGLEIRRNSPEKYGLKSFSEKTIESLVLVDQRRTRAKEACYESHKEVIGLKHEVDKLESDTNALEHKKKALENLVTLQGREYFAEPKAPRNRMEDVKAMERRQVFGKGKKKPA